METVSSELSAILDAENMAVNNIQIDGFPILMESFEEDEKINISNDQ